MWPKEGGGQEKGEAEEDLRLGRAIGEGAEPHAT